MAGPSLRHKRMVIHYWEQLFMNSCKMDRQAFRAMCASQLGFRKAGVVHTRYMTEMECDTILQYLQKLYENNKDIHELVDSMPNHGVWKEVRGLNKGPNHGISYNSDGSIIENVEDPVSV